MSEELKQAFPQGIMIQCAKPEIKILDNIQASCEIHKILLKGIISHLCIYLFPLEKVFSSFMLCYADLLCNQASFLPSPLFNEVFSVAFLTTHALLGLQEYLLHFVKGIRIILHS